MQYDDDEDFVHEEHGDDCSYPWYPEVECTCEFDMEYDLEPEPYFKDPGEDYFAFAGRTFAESL